MTHEAAREMLLDLACGELSGRDAARVEAHAAGCEACRAELAALRETRSLMSGLEPLAAPARGEAALLAAARVAAAESAKHPRPWRLPTWFLGASAVAAALVTMTAVSYRLLTAAPARRDDPEALLGRGTPSAPDQEVQAARAPQAATPSDGVAAPVAAPPSPAAPLSAPAPDAIPPTLATPSAPSRSPVAPPTAPPREEARPTVAAAPHQGAGGSFREAGQPMAASPIADAARAKAEARREQRAADLAPSANAGASRASAASASAEVARAPATRGTPAAAPEAGREVEETLALRAAAPSAAARGAAPTPGRAGTPRAAAAVERAPAEPGEPGELDALARWETLRDAGRLRRQVVTFPGCPGESRREVETDLHGRPVRHVRHGSAGGVPFDAELYYAEDGALGAVRYREAQGPWRELRLSPPRGAADAIPAAALEPRRAADAGVDAPPRCGG